MNSNMSSYDELIQKLDRFIRKFYINKTIKGVLFCTAIIIGLFLLFNLLENEFYFNTSIRKIFFGSFILISLLSLSYFVFLPLFKYFKLGKTISHENAANIIGEHFSDVKDKLLNILQLKKQLSNSAQKALLEASIEQKTNDIRIVPFKSAIDFGKNKKYVKYAAPPLFLLFGILFSSPSILKDSTSRIINNNKEYERPAPFHFNIIEENLEVVQYDDFDINVNITGDALPNEVYIDVDGFDYKMTKIENSQFVYTFRNVRKTKSFRIKSGDIISTKKELKVILKPIINQFELYLKYPNYIQKQNETILNIGDIKIPQGTSVNWKYQVENTDNISIKFRSDLTLNSMEQSGANSYSFSKKILKDDLYSIYISNESILAPDSMNFSLYVIEDQHPTIKVEAFQDSLDNNLIYFAGKASDDYGISQLTFNYSVTNDKGKSTTKSILIKQSSGLNITYEYTLDIQTLNLNPRERLDYFFEVFDNDAVNGIKSSKTQLMMLDKPSIDELEKQEEQNEDEIKKDLDKAIKDMKKLQEEFKKLREKLLEKKELNWQDKKDLEKLIEKQKEIKKKLDEAKKKFEENKKNEEQHKDQSPKLKEKQEKMQEMFNEVENKEMEDLMQKIEEMMQELNKDDAQKMMEQMEQEEQKQEMKMDRLLELYKQLEVEKDIQDQIEKLKELGDKQEKLGEESKKGEKNQEDLKKEQEEIDKEFNELKEKQKDIEKKNKNLEQPKDLDKESEEKMEDIQEDLDDSKKSLEEQKNQDASDSQKSAGKKMKKMAGDMESDMASGDAEQNEEDMKVIRQILENLITMSFDQELLEKNVNVVKKTTPRYVSLVKEEFKLKDDFKIVEDSLVALSKRVEEIESFVMEKVIDIKQDFKKTVDLLETRKKTEASVKQRQIMKNLNDLALMLDESLQNMQMKASGDMPGCQNCNKPGGKGKKPGKGSKPGKGPMDKISEGQKGMQGTLGKLNEKQKGGQKPGAKDFAQAAAQQAALRKLLQDVQSEKQGQGQGSKELQEIIDQMDKIETDLVNKRLDAEMMKRQQEIVTRLLEATKADRQREYDNKRKSETADALKKEMPQALKDYIKKRMSEIEMYKSVSPALRPYYRKMVNKYYKELKQN